MPTQRQRDTIDWEMVVLVWFDWVGFYGTSTIVGYLKPNPFFTYILDINVWFGWVLWHINHCWLFNAKSSFYIYIRYKCLVWLGFMAHQPLLVI